jgi:hypothetical protein
MVNKLGAFLLGTGAVLLGLWIAAWSWGSYLQVKASCIDTAALTGTMPAGCSPWRLIYFGGLILFGGLGAAGRMWSKR